MASGSLYRPPWSPFSSRRGGVVVATSPPSAAAVDAASSARRPTNRIPLWTRSTKNILVQARLPKNILVLSRGREEDDGLMTKQNCLRKTFCCSSLARLSLATPHYPTRLRTTPRACWRASSPRHVDEQSGMVGDGRCSCMCVIFLWFGG